MKLFTILSLSASCPLNSYAHRCHLWAQNVSRLQKLPGQAFSKVTYTLPLSVRANNQALWQAFLSFLTGVGFLQHWTATMEESTNAQEVGRIRLHVFVEFKQPVDWTSLDLVNTRLFREAAITAPIIKAL